MTAYRTKARRPYVAPELTLRRTYSIEERHPGRDEPWLTSENARREHRLMMQTARDNRRVVWARIAIVILSALIGLAVGQLLRATR